MTEAQIHSLPIFLKLALPEPRGSALDASIQATKNLPRPRHHISGQAVSLHRCLSCPQITIDILLGPNSYTSFLVLPPNSLYSQINFFLPL